MRCVRKAIVTGPNGATFWPKQLQLQKKPLDLDTERPLHRQDAPEHQFPTLNAVVLHW